MTDRVTREGAGAEERARELADRIDEAERLAGDQEFEEHPPFTERPEGMEELGARTARLRLEAITSWLDAALDAASAAATAKERNRAAKLAEAFHADCGEYCNEAIAGKRLAKAIRGDEQEGAPQEKPVPAPKTIAQKDKEIAYLKRIREKQTKHYNRLLRLIETIFGKPDYDLFRNLTAEVRAYRDRAEKLEAELAALRDALGTICEVAQKRCEAFHHTRSKMAGHELTCPEARTIIRVDAALAEKK